MCVIWVVVKAPFDKGTVEQTPLKEARERAHEGCLGDELRQSEEQGQKL